MIPDSPAAIDSSWLTEVLKTPVKSCRLLDAHAGTTGRAVIELEYATAADLPSRLFVKLPPNDEMQRLFVTSSGMGRREALFFQQLSAEVPVRVPRSFYAASDSAGENYIMLMEHLEDSGCTFRNASQHYSIEYVRNVLSEFAKLHAAYWQSERFKQDLAWVEPPMQHEIAVQLIQVALENHAAQMPDVFTHMAELYLSNTDAVHRLWERGPETLIHGDVHDANMFMDGARPGFLDWAVLARGPGMRDVGYFLAGTLEASDYEAFPELLAHYRECLEGEGVVPPSFDELMEQQRWHAAYVWVGAAVTLAMGDAWQPVEYVKSSLEKLHSAMEYLDSVAAIQAQT
jgi:Phosphotransferase enzyme family